MEGAGASMTQTNFPLAPVYWGNELEHRRFNAEAANRAINGKVNCVSTVTLTASTATTVVQDMRVGPDSFIGFMPTTSAAATELYGATMFVSSRATAGQFTITHANSGVTTRTFTYCVFA